MLRTTFVLALVVVGFYYALQSPFYGLLFYIWNAYFRPEEWIWGDLIRSLRLSLVIGSYVLITSLFSQHKFVWNGKVALLWSFLCLSVLSSILSEHSVYSWPYLVEFVKVVVITYLIVVLATDFAKFRWVILIMVLGLGIEQGKQGWSYLLTSPGGPNTNEVPFLGDNNGTAVGMLMLTPLVGLLSQITQNKRVKYFYYFLFIGCLYRALSTYSRGGFLASVAMGGVWWLRSPHKLNGLIALVTILVLVLPVLPDAFWARMNTIQTYEDTGDESALGRLYFWEVAVKMASANPLTGVGFNSYNVAYNDYDLSNGQYGRNRSVHSSHFGILAELGYIGFYLYLAIILGAFRSCSQVRRIVVRNPALADFGKGAIALESSLTAFVVGGSFVPLQYNEMFWHLIGLTIVLKQLADQHERQDLSPEQLIGQPPPSPPKDPVAA